MKVILLVAVVLAVIYAYGAISLRMAYRRLL
jgi:hypothetical protein